MPTHYADLMLDNGELIRIECPGKFEDEWWGRYETEEGVA
jgi:hypothetical protein